MNGLLKKIITVMLAASMTLTAMPVFARGDAAVFDAQTAANTQSTPISARRAHTFATTYTLDSEQVFSLDALDKSAQLVSITEVTNNTASAARYNAVMYAVTADGAKAAVSENIVSCGKGESVEINLTPDMNAVPDDAVKLVTEIKVTGDKTYKVSELEILGYSVSVPDKVQNDFWSIFGAHDPSIVKFGDTYYAYSSHNIIFTSDDLITWTKHDFNNTYRTAPIDGTSLISQKTYDFIRENIDTNVNGTYWAPDVIYVPEDTETPYWMYISVSCGLGGRNSVISLMKSPTPLFWADTKQANIDKIVDAGIVFATKETADYKTNAIDANIYTDASGNRYFIWGSFWGGIQGARLTADGFVEGVKYDGTGAELLASCANFGKTLFAQKNGIAGPEGAWMIENGEYRYMFTSYGWLGSNYNTRVARSPLTTDFQNVLASASGTDDSFLDADGTVMGAEAENGSLEKPTGYKLIGSYRLGDAVSDRITGNDGGYSLYYMVSDPTIYYGPGHNSVLNDNGNYYYVSHVRKNYPDGAAFLQVRKLMWTEDGWPVVSPVAYAGEVEQKLPESMILGTYDFASVGQTKISGSEIRARNFDLPVLSSKVTLLEDGTMADDLGTWEFDGDHTVTLTFAKDGDTSKDEFYKNGDTVTMKALLSFDEDSGKYVIALTGIDQNHITQFAVKPMGETASDVAEVQTEPVVIEKSVGSNPALGFDGAGNVLYAGDPAATVIDDTVYLYAGHDTASGEGYEMPEWVLYTSKDMTNWEYKGVVLKATDISWRNDDTSAWAGQMVPYNGKYYFYFCTWDKTSDGKQSIGVAVADKPEGPFADIGAPLVKGTLTEPESSGWNDIDPTAWIETDENGVEHRYLAWGNGKYYRCELNEDMTSVKDLNGDGSITMGADIFEQSFENMGSTVFTEAPWLYRRKDENGTPYGQYYTFFAQNWREEMGYAVSDDLSTNKWTYKGQLMPPTATSNTNHPSVIDFNGKTYFIYHNGALTRGSGFRRSICIQELAFDRNGDVYPIPELSTGVDGKAVMLKDTNGSYVAHEDFVNSSADADYPLNKNVFVLQQQNGLNTSWEIVKGLYAPENENYVSIQAVNKPGLYLKNDNNVIMLTQNADGEQAKSMTFKTVKALDGTAGAVSFESVSEPGKFLTSFDGRLALTYGARGEHCSFTLDENIKVSVTEQYASNGVVGFNLNNGAVYDELTAYVAEYSDGALIGVGLAKITAAAIRQAVEIPYTQKAEGSTLKLFVWHGMTPLTNVDIVTAMEKPVPEGCTAYFGFEDNLENSVTGVSGKITGSKINEFTDKTDAEYADGYDGRAVSFTGAGSYGVNLGNIITDKKYTVSFRIKANEFTACTAALFVDADRGARWLSMPIGWRTDGTMMVWSNNGGAYLDFVSSGIVNTGEWYNITIAANGGRADMYINGGFVGSGAVADVVNINTQTFLAVNYWDTPFNGMIDELYVYNGTVLNADDVKTLYEATK